MPAFFTYLQNITYYLIFASVVGMLAPQGKYRKFVSLVMGFILLSLMIAPLTRFSDEIPITDWFTLPTNTTPAADPQASYAHWRDTYLRGAFNQQLTTQLENLLHTNGFTVHDIGFTFPDDFSRIDSIYATVSREETPQRVPFIRIQPVQINRDETKPECPTSTEAKNLISEFYNLPQAHIHITVR